MENRLLIGIRYLTIFLVILGISMVPLGDRGFLTVIFVLLFIINTQLRSFLWRGKAIPIVLSLVADCFLGTAIVKAYAPLLLPFFALLVLDSLSLMSVSLRPWSLTAVWGAFLFLAGTLPASQPLITVGTLALFTLLAAYAARGETRALKAEDLYYQLQKSEARLLDTNRELELYAEAAGELARLQERNRISREIHDSVGHSLSTIIIQLEALSGLADRDGHAAAAMAGNLRDFAKSGLEEVRRALQELKPQEYARYETILMLETLTANFSRLTGIEVKLTFSESRWQLSEEASLVIYRAVQEFLSNAARHGRATKVTIFIHYDPQALILTMQDNGVGTEQVTPGLGLTGLTERVRELGGEVRLSSSPGQGFRLRLSLTPLGSDNY